MFHSILQTVDSTVFVLGVPRACSVPPVWQEQTTELELCFQEHGTSGKVCSQAVLQD